MDKELYQNYKANQQLHSIVSQDPTEIMIKLYGQDYLEYRKLWKKTFDEFWAPPFPLHLDIDLQDACNLRCKICHQNYRRRSNEIIEWTFLEQALKEGSKHGLKAVNFGASAEPLLQKSLLQNGISLARQMGIMDIFIHTNGLLLDKETAKSLIEARPTHIAISIDAASKETYRKIRRIDLYNQLLKNINYLLAEKAKTGNNLPIVRVSFCVSPDNHHEKQKFIDIWEGKVDLIEFQDIRIISETDIKYPNFKQKKFRCANPFRRVMLWPDGMISLCCGYRENDVILGHISSGLKTIWEGLKLKTIRNAFKSEELHTLPRTCQKCINSLYSHGTL